MASLRRQRHTRRRRPGPDAARASEPAAREAARALAFAAEQTGEITTRLKEMIRALDVDRLEQAGATADTRRSVKLLAAYVRQLHDEATELSTRVGAARRELRLPEMTAPPPPFSAAGRPQQPERQPAREPRARSLSKGMRMLITQMTAAGSSRVEIEERLRDDFGVRDARLVVDDVLDRSDAPADDE